MTAKIVKIDQGPFQYLFHVAIYDEQNNKVTNGEYKVNIYKFKKFTEEELKQRVTEVLNGKVKDYLYQQDFSGLEGQTLQLDKGEVK